MAYCEMCGREIPDGQRRCAHCAPEARQADLNWKEELSAKASPDGGEPDPGPEPEDPGPSPQAPGPKARGRGAVAVMSAALALFLVFFALAVFWGGRGSGGATPSRTLESWQGDGGQDAAPADPGPDTLTLTAPDAQAVLDNTQPETAAAVHTYQIVVEDVSWQEAYDRAQAAGGHLATITSQEEFDAICTQADQAAVITQVRYLWLGARQGSAGWTGSDCWITGEDWTFDAWYPGEPSGQDEDGTPENVLCMWNVQQSGWTFNDQRNDLLSVLPQVSGKVGYVIEFEG